MKKVRTVVKFRRPKTLRLKRAPKFPKKSVPNRDRMDAYSVIRLVCKLCFGGWVWVNPKSCSFV